MPHLVPVSVMIVLGLAVLLGLLSTVLMVVSVATDYWEHTDYRLDVLTNLTNLNKNASYFSENDRFYKIVLKDPLSDNVTHREYYLRSSYGGIWRICDYITGKHKYLNPVFLRGDMNIPSLYNPKPFTKGSQNHLNRSVTQLMTFADVSQN